MTEYVLSQRASPDVERTRLRFLEEYHDPLTVSQLDAIGVGEGWRCLDVGAGGGSVTRMLADRVGSTGSILAVDLDTSRKNVTVAGGNTFTISGGQVITVGGGNGVTVASAPVNARGPAIGQATLAGHLSLTFGVLSVSLAGASAAIGSGGGAGKVAAHEITISKKRDAPSPKLSLACARGTRSASAAIALRNAGGNKRILIYRLSGVQISSYQIGSAARGGAAPLDRLMLSYSTIKIQSTTQK